jgi:hypothetical protein
MNKDLEARFDKAIMDVYKRVLSECDYKSIRSCKCFMNIAALKPRGFCSMLLRFQKVTLHCGNGKRLDLTVEAIVLEPEWHFLFSEQEREIARKRLGGIWLRSWRRF